MNLFNWNDEDAQKEVLSGLRLYRLEIYNWGTFDKKIWVYEPKGETSLLTGDSGSGKSTIVDALTTLLVSPKKIAYNKAADASAKERTLSSYVQGVYGQKTAYEGKGKQEALRGINHFSVILGVFKDEAQDKIVTLANFFWFKEQTAAPSRLYVIAPEELTIKKDFTDFGSSVKDLKARLKLGGAQLFDSHKEYEECYRSEFGKIKPQAISLFQQTISMKKVEALTNFVRDNMLEETGVSEEVDKLLRHFYDLNAAHEAVICARKQIDILTPIYTEAANRAAASEARAQIERAQKAIPYWFALIKEDLLKKREAELSKALCDTLAARTDEENTLLALDAEIDRLNKDIWQNGGQALETLKAEQGYRQQELERRETKLTRYKESADKAGIAVAQSAGEFSEQTLKIPEQIKSLEASIKTEETESNEKHANLRDIKYDSDKIELEITSLRKRESNIPEHLIKLRAGLCADLKIAQGDIPFAGELIEVKESEANWEGAVERLMHGFAMSLIVSDRWYDAVSTWVNQRPLGARLVYLHTKAVARAEEMAQLHPNAAANKVCFKEDSPHYQWLSSEVRRQFNHVCCDDLAVFQRSSKAITKTGQIKSKQRHEKDDRSHITDRTRYVLGFSSKKKIAALTEKLAHIVDKKNIEDAAIAAIEQRKRRLGTQKDALSILATFKDFSEIDVAKVIFEIAGYTARIDQIQSSDRVLNVLTQQRDAAKRNREEQKAKVNELRDQYSRLDARLEELRGDVLQNKEKLMTESEIMPESYAYLEENKQGFIGKAEITLSGADHCERNYSGKLYTEITSLNHTIAVLASTIEKAMKNFMVAFPNDAKELEDKIEYLDEYLKILQQLNRDDLPRFEANFKELLRSKMLQQISLFHMTLKNHSSDIKERIEDINQSMHKIDYNEGRYIRLNCDDNIDSEIKEFKARLKICTEGITRGIDNNELSEAKFVEIKKILSRFQGREKESEADKRWTKKVTDVRNWFLFSASERFRETDEEYAFYPDSGGKSGGQKEKLAYTILAASLVYNYGLHEELMVSTSFRLVAIDEAFLKSSDDSAKFGLELFRTLDFQLVIVTPLLKISTIEPYISHVGFVNHDDLTHQSAIMNITIDEYRERRKEWERENGIKLDGK